MLEDGTFLLIMQTVGHSGQISDCFTRPSLLISVFQMGVEEERCHRLLDEVANSLPADSASTLPLSSVQLAASQSSTSTSTSMSTATTSATVAARPIVASSSAGVALALRPQSSSERDGYDASRDSLSSPAYVSNPSPADEGDVEGEEAENGELVDEDRVVGGTESSTTSFSESDRPVRELDNRRHIDVSSDGIGDVPRRAGAVADGANGDRISPSSWASTSSSQD